MWQKMLQVGSGGGSGDYKIETGTIPAGGTTTIPLPFRPKVLLIFNRGTTFHVNLYDESNGSKVDNFYKDSAGSNYVSVALPNASKGVLNSVSDNGFTYNNATGGAVAMTYYAFG